MDRTYNLKSTASGKYDLNVLNGKGIPIITAKGISFSEAVAMIENETYQSEERASCGTSET